MKKLALIVSRIFEPMIVFSGLLVAGALRANLRGTTLVRFLATVFVSMILPAAALRFFLFRAYRIDWDIRERSKRIVPLFLLLGLSVINFWIVQRWNNSLLTDMFLLFLLWLWLSLISVQLLFYFFFGLVWCSYPEFPKNILWRYFLSGRYCPEDYGFMFLKIIKRKEL